MKMFEEIDKVKKDLPKLNTIGKDLEVTGMNIYQKISVVIFLIFLFIGILLGNLFPSCGSSSEFYGGYCMATEFNFSLMLFIWFIDFLISMFFYAIGHIIALLTAINEKLAKK